MNLQEWAQNELDLLVKEGGKEQSMVNKDIMEIVNKILSQGHSGFSISYVMHVLSRLMAYKPLQPLTGEESEWYPIREYDKNSRQNMRCSSVFQDITDGFTYDVSGVLFYEEGDEENTFSNGARVKEYYREIGGIAFPYSPPDKPVLVMVPREEPQEEKVVSEG